MSRIDFFSKPDNANITVEWTVYSVLQVWLVAGLKSKMHSVNIIQKRLQLMIVNTDINLNNLTANYNDC